MNVKSIILFSLIVWLLAGCTYGSETEHKGQSIGTIIEEEGTGQGEEGQITESSKEDVVDNKEVSPYSHLEPKEYEYVEGDYEFSFAYTIHNENLYADTAGGYKAAGIEWPDIEIKPELEDYLVKSDWDGEGKYDDLVVMFYDYRTLEIGEDALVDLFVDHGYFLYFHYGKAGNLNFRIVEIQEREGLSTYPCRILIQSWDEKHIYVMDMTADIPRKVRNLMVIDNRRFPQIIIHASAFDRDFTAQEELIFFAFKRTGWVPCRIDLEFEEHEKFVATYYADGIAFAPGPLTEVYAYTNTYTYLLGASEEVEKNRHFRMYTIRSVVGVTVGRINSEGFYNGYSNYIDFYIAEE